MIIRATYQQRRFHLESRLTGVRNLSTATSFMPTDVRSRTIHGHGKDILPQSDGIDGCVLSLCEDGGKQLNATSTVAM